MIIAFDLGTRTGWASSGNAGIVIGHADFKNSRFEGGGMRYLRFRGWLDGFTKAGPIECVFFEEVRAHMGTDAAHVYGGLLAELTAWCDGQNPKVPYQGIPVGTIKKFATGKGNANKEKMMRAAKKAGVNPTDDNEADAYWILQCGMQDIDIFS